MLIHHEEPVSLGPVIDRRSAEALAAISPENQRRITARMRKEHSLTEDVAESTLREAVRFVTMAVLNPVETFAPSKEVDIGWHALLMYTRAYHDLCAALGKSFIHHEPNDREVRHTGAYPATIQFMQKHGISFDDALWPRRNDIADCTPDPCTCTGD